MNKGAGRVYLVGAGPGAPDLITLRAAAVMRGAQVVVHDSLVSPEVLALAAPGAEIIFAGKRGGAGREFDQEEINQILIEHARAGKIVVRLKGGDPFVFGRGGEEAAALAAAKVQFEVVPGITSAVAAPAFAGIPLTHREHASSVTFMTGHEDFEKNPAAASRWDEIAGSARDGTLVILMSTARMRANLERLVSAGLSAQTPAAAIQWGTTAAQRTALATIGTLAEEATRAGIGAPAVIVVGQCAHLRTSLQWFEKLPLFGRRIVVTRAAAGAAQLAERLRALGAEAIEFPTIETAPPESYEALDNAIARLGTWDWIVFTSAMGVEAFVGRLRALGRDIREVRNASIAAIGPATAARVRSYALSVAAMPTEYRAEGLIGAIGAAKLTGGRILIPRAAIAREVLPQLLREKGAAEVTVAPAYRTVKPARADRARICELAAAGAIDLVTFTSSSTVTNFRDLTGELQRRLKAAVIGPITEETARSEGFEVVVSAKKYTVDALLDAIVAHFQPSG